MLKIKSIQDIQNDLLINKKGIRNFPKSTSFPFDALYLDIVTQIKTVEISSECILLDSVHSYNENKEFADTEYWKDNYDQNEINKFWFFGQNGQGDLWLFDINKKVYFYDHEKEQMCKENFIDLDLNFKRWMQFSYLNKQLDEYYDVENEISQEIKIEYKTKLKEISKSLLDNYPFEI